MAMNLDPDDMDGPNKGKRHLKWDQNKKRYVEHQEGRDGKAVRVRNESGKAVNDKKKAPEIYKQWMKRSHMRIQKGGELEDEKAVAQVKSGSKNRREMKAQYKANPRAKQELK